MNAYIRVADQLIKTIYYQNLNLMKSGPKYQNSLMHTKKNAEMKKGSSDISLDNEQTSE